MAQAFQDAENEVRKSAFLRNMFRDEAARELLSDQLSKRREVERPKERIPYPY